MLLYKYLSSDNGIRVLESGKLRFSQPSVLNDPFELRPEYQPLQDAEYTQGELSEERLRKRTNESIEDFKNQFADLMVQLPPDVRIDNDEIFAGVGEQVNEFMSQFFEGLNSRIPQAMIEGFEKELGILCLSELRNDLAMWSHYNEHRGIAVGFNSEHSFFNQKLHESDPFRHVKKIVYTPERAKVQVLDLDDDADDLLYTKLEHIWAYEAEWRMMLPLVKANQVIEANPPICLFNFPPDAVKEVLIGCRASEEMKVQLLACLSEDRYSHVNLILTELPTQGVELVCNGVDRSV